LSHNISDYLYSFTHVKENAMVQGKVIWMGMDACDVAGVGGDWSVYWVIGADDDSSRCSVAASGSGSFNRSVDIYKLFNR
jgi:hypothetical protein